MSKFRRVASPKSINRVLLTEVAPFELPPNLMNFGFFEYAESSQMRFQDDSLTWIDRANPSDSYLAVLIAGSPLHADVQGPTDGRMRIEFKKTPWKLPYKFWIHKADGQKRTLSLPHPLSQLSIVDFYREFAGVMAFHTSRSDFSLRRPERAARFTFSEDQMHAKRKTRRGEGIEVVGTELETVGSFFRYRRYSNINKFYESRHFHKLEARYPLQRRLDVTRCFESLYTHSVDWAVRGHHASKSGIGEDIFSTKLDKLFQSANNGQTNGVLVGPEFSRIFAEVILQCVDLEVQSDLLVKGLRFEDHYWIGRYVDDYFIFCENDRDAAIIQNEIETQLEKFNLRLNRSKQLDFRGPSFSPIHTAKQRLARKVSRFYRLANDAAEHESSDRKVMNLDSLISSYKSVLNDLTVMPAEVNNFVLGVIEKRVDRIGRATELYQRGANEVLARTLRDSVLLVEFLYASSASVPSALRASRILLQTLRIAEKLRLERDLRLSLRAEVDRTTRAALARHNRDEPGLAGAERFYWLLLHAELGRSVLLSQVELRHVLDRASVGGSDYLLLVTVLQYMQDRKRFDQLRADLCDRVEGIVQKLRPQTAERAMLQADLLACPYIENSYKQRWMAAWFPDRSANENSEALRHWPRMVFAAWKSFNLESALRAKKSREVY